MAWGRLALLYVAAEEQAIRDKTAVVFGYVKKVQSSDDSRQEHKQKNTSNTNTSVKSDTEEAQVQRKPARFLRVNRKQQLAKKNDSQIPTYLTDPDSLILEKSQGSYTFPTALPLLSAAQLLPFLFNALGVERATRRIDHRRLLCQIERGKPLDKAPYVNQQRWSQELLIIVDVSTHLEPYWTDFDQIVTQMKTVLGQVSVTAIRFDENTLGSKEPRYIVWPTTNKDRYQTWKMPAADVPVLILSDLGVIDPNYRMAVRWRRFFQPLQQQQTKMVTLSPAAQSPYQPLFCQHLKPTPLNDVRTLPRNPYCYGFYRGDDVVAKPIKIERILGFLSALPVVDSALLRRLRLALQWGDSALEGVIWNHPKVYDIGLGIRLYETEAEHYRKEYQHSIAGTAEAKHFWHIVHSHHQHAFTGLKTLEKLNQCALEQTYDENLEDYLQQFCVSLSRTVEGSAQHQALLLQGRTLLASLPEKIWRSQFTDGVHTLYALVNVDDIRASKWPDILPDGLEQDKIKWIVDEKERHSEQSWLLIQQGDQGEFSFIEAEKRTELTMPIAEFSEIKGLSPTLKEPQSNITRSLKAGRLYTFLEQEAVLALRSTTHHLDIEAIQKPTWAQRIGQNQQGLYVAVSWLGQTLTFPWQMATDDATTGQWQWQAPFGEDGYGVYANLVIEGITQRFRWIDPTMFMMGSPEDEIGRWDDYEALHQVTLTQGYWLAETTVTQALWQAVMGDNPSYFTAEKTGLNATENHPVEQVSWNECQRFIDTVKQKFPQLNCRLPTEAEWENACRAGTNSSFNFAGELDVTKVNYSGVFKKEDASDFHKDALQQTAAVKSYPCNIWGLYEMHGNVWEWCEDFWVNDLGTELVIDPKGAKEGTERVLRGGGWLNNGGHARSAVRNDYSPDNRDYSIGLRLALPRSPELQPA